MSRDNPAVSHNEVQQALPAFIRGQLSSSRQRTIQEHIALCPDCAQRHQDELKLSSALVQDPMAIEGLLTTEAREANFGRLLGRIAAPGQGAGDSGQAAMEAERQQQAATPGRYRGWLATAASVALIMAIGVPWLQQSGNGYQGTDNLYRTRSAVEQAPAVTPGQQQAYRVVFEAGLDPQHIEALFQALDANLLAGPSAKGVYTVTLPEHGQSTEDDLARLRQQPAIIFAEPSVHRDR